MLSNPKTSDEAYGLRPVFMLLSGGVFWEGRGPLAKQHCVMSLYHVIYVAVNYI